MAEKLMKRVSPMPPQWYEIRVEGELTGDWANWFEGLDLSPGQPGESVLSGLLPDQAALHGVLAKIRDMNLHLISVSRVGMPGKKSKGESLC